jgi:hypothetical protein
MQNKSPCTFEQKDERRRLKLGMRMIAIMSTMAVASAARAADSDVDALLDKARQAVAWCTLSATTTQIVSKVEQDGQAVQTLQGTMRRFRDGAKVREVLDATVEARGQKDARRSDVLFADGMRVFYVEGISAQVAMTPDKSAKYAVGTLVDSTAGGFLDGFFDFCNGTAKPTMQNQCLFDLAQSGNATLRTQDDSTQGVVCKVVDSETSLGHLAIWIAPSEGFNVAKVEFSRTGAVAQPYSILFDQAEFGQNSGRNVLIRGHFRQTAGSPAHAGMIVVDVTAHRTAVDSAPTFDASTFNTSFIKDGTQTFVEEDLGSGVQYVWQDGKAVPYKDEATLTSIHDQIAEVRAENGAGDSPTTQASSSAPQEAVGDGFIQPTSLSPWVIGGGIGAGAILLVIAGLLAWPKRKNV